MYCTVDTTRGKLNLGLTGGLSLACSPPTMYLKSVHNPHIKRLPVTGENYFFILLGYERVLGKNPVGKLIIRVAVI